MDIRRCQECRNGMIFVSAYDYTPYVECSLQSDSSKLSTEALKHLIEHPEEKRCKFVKGSPVYKRITFDD